MQLTCFTELIEKALLTQEPFINDFIKGHLMLEFLMLKCVEIIMPEKKRHSENLTHFKLILFLFKHDIIDLNMKEALIEINKMRNQFAHNITYTPTISEYKNILLLAQKASHDMTDGIMQSLEEVEGKCNLLECEPIIFVEPFLQLSYDLHNIYQENGGDIEFFIVIINKLKVP